MGNLAHMQTTTLRPVQTHSTLYTIQHSSCILYKVECVWTPCIVPTIHDSTSLIVYSDVWNWSNFYSTTTRLFLCFAITEAILYKVELEHYTACEHAQSKSTKSHTNKSSKWRRATILCFVILVEWLYSPCIVRLNTLPNNAIQCRSYKVECCIVRV